MTLARRYAVLGILALFALQFFWHGFLVPANITQPWLVVMLLSLPLMPSLILLLIRHPSAVFWGSVAALFYFCHGVAETYANKPAWPLSLTETALSVWVVLTGSWDGMRVRFNKSKAASTNG